MAQHGIEESEVKEHKEYNKIAAVDRAHQHEIKEAIFIGVIFSRSRRSLSENFLPQKRATACW